MLPTRAQNLQKLFVRRTAQNLVVRNRADAQQPGVFLAEQLDGYAVRRAALRPIRCRIVASRYLALRFTPVAIRAFGCQRAAWRIHRLKIVIPRQQRFGLVIHRPAFGAPGAGNLALAVAEPARDEIGVPR